METYRERKRQRELGCVWGGGVREREREREREESILNACLLIHNIYGYQKLIKILKANQYTNYNSNITNYI